MQGEAPEGDRQPEIVVALTTEPIARTLAPPASADCGALIEFRGIVRGSEGGRAISALRYEAYPSMALGELRRIALELAARHGVHGVGIVHRHGVIRVGETAVHVGVSAAHRGEAMAFLGEFIDALKRDVPIWKVEALP